MFSFTQMLLMISWGRASDKYGRKPVLVVSLMGVTVATTLFGFSKTIWQMIIFRCIAGVFAGTIVTVRAMISENTTKKTQAVAFSYFAFTAFLGTLFGPLLGGILCNPAEQYPGLFGNVQFFINYPYAFPTFGTGLFSLIATLLAYFFLEETIDKKSAGTKGSSDVKMSIWELLKYPGVATVLVLWSFVMILAFAHTIVLPLFWFTTPELGGFGFSPRQISLFLGMAGGSQALWTLFVFPALHCRIGTGGVMRMCSLVWPFMFAAWPLCNVLLKQEWATAFWVVASVNDTIGGVVNMAFSMSTSSLSHVPFLVSIADFVAAAVQLAMNDICPSQHSLGTLTAVSLVVTSALRAIAPALFTTLFAVGVGERILGGYLVWLVMVCIAVGFAVCVPLLPNKAGGKVKEDDE